MVQMFVVFVSVVIIIISILFLVHFHTVILNILRTTRTSERTNLNRTTFCNKNVFLFIITIKISCQINLLNSDCNYTVFLIFYINLVQNT